MPNSPAQPQEHKRTVVAAVPPGPAEAAAVSPRSATRRREERVGTHISGTDGLHEPGSDQPRLRLVAGKIVPGTRYRILRWLGEGGMGVVYEAEHIDIERRVALKILRFDLSQEPKMAQVFRDEARAASRIGSRHIVEIFDFGELRDGRLFFCMEMLAGHDLVPPTEDDWIEPPRLIGILRQMASGLGAAHRQGIVHRDIKPENIILVPEGQRDLVKIVDFGISSMLAANTEEGTGQIAGTPHYMAPEQISGGRFDGRLDMYALGCMAYELLVGTPPFMAENLEDLLRQQLNEAPKPIRQARPDRDIPKPLEEVILRCLAKRPADRYRDMADLEAALCEAQIAAGLQTLYDDLPLPEGIDDARREKLLRQMPSPTGQAPAKRRLLWPILAGAMAVVAGLALVFALRAGQPTDLEKDQIEELTIEARNAAALTHYVYPPVEEPKSATAYTKVVELEGLEGAARVAGEERAGELRQQFATTLVTLGDKYWEFPGARSFAYEYYGQALLFDPENARAKERNSYTPGMLAELRENALNGTWSTEVLTNAQWANVLAEEDDTQLLAKAEQLAEASGDDASALVQAKAVSAARSRGVTLREKKSENGGSGGGGAVDASDAGTGGAGTGGAVNPTGPTEGAGEGEEPIVEDDPFALVEGPETGGKKTGKKGSKDAKLGSNKRDPAHARELADKGMTALNSGRRSEAQSLFEQAISYDNRNAKALMGLSTIYFDTGADQKAVLFAERAVQAAPGTASYRLSLGDAYYKVLRYRDALEQYEKAKDLGSNRADDRIAKVKPKVGG